MSSEEVLPEEVELSADLDDVDLGEDEEEGGEEFYDNSHLVFDEHSGPTFVVNLDPKHGKYAVSGGEDDKGFVWEIETGAVLFECTGHKDSVTCAEFSSDSVYVATGDMSGLIKVWKVVEKAEVCQFETSDLEWITWHPIAPILMAGAQDGNAWLWKVPSGESKFFQSPGCSCTCGKILPKGKTAALGYQDGSLRIFDLKSQDCLHSFSKGRDLHRAPVNQIECDYSEQNLVSASLDGFCKFINPSTGKVSTTHRCEAQGDEDSSVECLSFSERFHLLAIASLNGVLFLFDVRSGNIRHKFQHPFGVTRQCWSSDQSKMVTACLDGIARIWDTRSGNLLGTCVGHTDQLVDLALTRDDRWLTTASMDGTVRVFSFHTCLDTES